MRRRTSYYTTVRVPQHQGRLPRHINVRPGPIGRKLAEASNVQEPIKVVEATEAQGRVVMYVLLVCFYIAVGIALGGWPLVLAFIAHAAYRAKTYNDAVREAKDEGAA